MIHKRTLCLLTVLGMLGAARAQETAPEKMSVPSPDGKYKVVRHSPKEVDDGAAVYTVVEAASGDVVWSAPDDFADSMRPEHTILWSPDSQRFAIGCRISIRRIALRVYGRDGDTFVQQWDGAGKLEEMAYANAEAAMKQEKFRAGARLGRCIGDESRPEKWADASSLIVTRSVDCTVVNDDADEGAVTGTARVLLRWDAGKKKFVMGRKLAADGEGK